MLNFRLGVTTADAESCVFPKRNVYMLIYRLSVILVMCFELLDIARPLT